MTDRKARSHPLLAALLTSSLALGLAGCGDDGDGDTSGSEASASEPAEETTTAPTEPTAEDSEAAELTGEEAEVGDTVATVFDSSVPFEDKVDLLEDGESHQADHEGYVTVADGVGGITVEATSVEIEGDTASVIYRVLFAGTETYSGLSLEVTRVDDAWMVPTTSFCGFLAAAQTPCSEAS